VSQLNEDGTFGGGHKIESQVKRTERIGGSAFGPEVGGTRSVHVDSIVTIAVTGAAEGTAKMGTEERFGKEFRSGN
jgi:hypothetical protein